MTTDDRIAVLETQVRTLRRALVAVGGMVVLGGLLAATTVQVGAADGSPGKPIHVKVVRSDASAGSRPMFNVGVEGASAFSSKPITIKAQ